MSQFELTSDWNFDAAQTAVWQALSAPEDWPRWWRAVMRVETLEPGGRDSLGALRRMTWRTALLYALT
jgi:uncharacterized protein YndB with AHSA1/START domain